MREKELELAGGSLYYEIKNGKAEITRFQGLASEVWVPDMLDGCPVTTMLKKAFLSKKNLRRVILPDTLEEAGDWSFAYCANLTEVCIPGKELRFGKAVFLECKELKRISMREDGSNPDYQPELLAAAVKDFEAYYLLDIPAVGSKEWLDKWDSRLAAVLHAPDHEGYSRQVLCGEEDYGSTDLKAYTNGKRKKKVRLVLLRLLFSYGLTDSFKEELEQYLLNHTKGCDSEETWQVVWKEYGNDRAYYSLFAELGCVNSRNLDGILADIGEDLPEMKAYFLRYCEDSSEGRNFFDDLEL